MNENINFCTKFTWVLHEWDQIHFNNQQEVYSLDVIVLQNMGLNCYIYQNIILNVNLNNNLVDGHAIMSLMMSHDCCIHFYGLFSGFTFQIMI